MPAAYEEVLAFILTHLNGPVEERHTEDGAVVVSEKEPCDVIVRLTETDVTVAEYSLEWRSDTNGAVEPIAIGTVAWSAISAEAAMRTLRALIDAAREARRMKSRVCVVCERTTPPEWMETDDVCQECAAEDYGPVH